MDDIRDLLKRAIELHGSQKNLGKACADDGLPRGYSQNAISAALLRGTVSPWMARRIQKATGGAVAAGRLCPELKGWLQQPAA